MFIDTPDGRLAVRVTAVRPDGYDWVAEDGASRATGCHVPLLDEHGAEVWPEAAPSLEERVEALERTVGVDGISLAINREGDGA